MEQTLVTIATFDNQFEAELAKSVLENYGFEVYVLNERMMATYPSMAGDMYRIELQVSDVDSEKAAEVLESLNDSSYISELLKDENALLEGHFLLASGKHSGRYIEKIRILQNPEVAHNICKRLASRIGDFEFDAVVGPAYGGIALAFDVAKLLDKDFLFTQRKDEVMIIRSGFELSNIKKVAIIEDIVTTGGSIVEVIDCLNNLNIEVAVIAAIVDRSGGIVDFGYPFESLMSVVIPTWEPEDCELCVAGEPLFKPGSSLNKN